MRLFGVATLTGLLTLVVEVVVFLGAVRLVGLAWALLALIAVSVLGGWLVRREGSRSWRRFRAAAEAGRPPGREVSDGLTGLIGALLLAVPGFVTGLVGALLIVPPVRWLARDGLERAATRRVPPVVAGNLFGPRRVRVRRTGRWSQPGPATGPTGPTPPVGPAIEGEVVDDRPAGWPDGPDRR